MSTSETGWERQRGVAEMQKIVWMRCRSSRGLEGSRWSGVGARYGEAVAEETSVDFLMKSEVLKADGRAAASRRRSGPRLVRSGGCYLGIR